MKKTPDYEKRRLQMVRDQLEYRHIRDERLLAAMRKVPRHEFVPEDQRYLAYDDRPLAIGEQQTISQPYIVALMTQLLELSGEERVLEIGTGSGYQAAVLAELAKAVYSVERHKPLAKGATAVLQKLGYQNVQVRHGDGSGGWPKYAPYQAIMVTAAAPSVPEPLMEQLAVDGRLVLPVGGASGQYLQRWRRHDSGYTYDMIVPVAFVPLRGEFGWDDKEWDRSFM